MVYPIPGLVERRRSVLLFNHWPEVDEHFAGSLLHVPEDVVSSSNAPECRIPTAVPIHAVTVPPLSTPGRTLQTFPAMYKDRHAINEPDLPRSQLVLSLWYIDDLVGAIMSTKGRMPWSVPARRIEEHIPIPDV